MAPLLTQSIWQIATHLEESNNRGAYSRSIKQTFGIDPTDIPKEQRDGILYYSRGHGWRVRKNPHWREVFAQRYPHTMELIGSEE